MDLYEEKFARLLLLEVQKLADVIREKAPLGATRSLQRSFRVATYNGKRGGPGARVESTRNYARFVFETKTGQPWIKFHVPAAKLGQTSFAELAGGLYKPQKGRVYKTPTRARQYMAGLKGAHEGQISSGYYVANYPEVALRQVGGIEGITERLQSYL